MFDPPIWTMPWTMRVARPRCSCLQSSKHAYETMSEEEHQRVRDNNACMVERFPKREKTSELPLGLPLLARIDLCAWLDFLFCYGFTSSQVQHMLFSQPSFLDRATLITAGLSLSTLKEAGIDRETSMSLITQYPQLLYADVDEIERMIHLFTRFSSGIDIKS